MFRLALLLASIAAAFAGGEGNYTIASSKQQSQLLRSVRLQRGSVHKGDEQQQYGDAVVRRKEEVGEEEEVKINNRADSTLHDFLGGGEIVSEENRNFGTDKSAGRKGTSKLRLLNSSSQSGLKHVPNKSSLVETNVEVLPIAIIEQGPQVKGEETVHVANDKHGMRSKTEVGDVEESAKTIRELVEEDSNGTNFSSMDKKKRRLSQAYGLAVYPAADSYIRAGSYTSSNYGSEEILIVKNVGNADYKRKSLLFFDNLPDFVPNAFSVRLRIYVENVWVDVPQQITISRLRTDASWDENSLSWSSFESSLVVEREGNTFTITKDDKSNWVEVDVSDLLIGLSGRQVHFLLENKDSSQNSGFVFHSKEKGQDLGPVLYGFSIKPTADSFVRDGDHSNVNYGSSTSLTVKSDYSSYRRISFLKFNMHLPEFFPLVPAKLRLFVVATGSDELREITVSRISSSYSWSEGQLKWNSFNPMPPAYEKVGNFLAITKSDAGKWVEVDVSNLLVDGELTLVLENLGAKSSQSHVVFGSKENSGLEPHVIFDDLALSELRVGEDMDYCMDLFISAGTISLYECHEGDNQLWSLDSSGFIRSGVDRLSCLQLQDSSASNGSGIKISTCDNSVKSQKWESVSGGALRSEVDPTKCIGLDGSAANGGSIALQVCNGASTQVWMSLHNLLQDTLSTQKYGFWCLEVQGSSTSNGTPLAMGRCDGSKKQKFRFDVKEGLIYSGLTEHEANDEDKKCVDLKGGNKSNGAVLQIHQCIKGHKNKMWHFYNNIISLADDSRFVLDQSVSLKTKVQLFTYHGGMNQRFLMGSPGRQFFVDSIASQSDDTMCLEVQGGSTSNGTPLKMAKCDNSQKQQWTMNGDGLVRSALSSSKCIDLSGGNKSNGGKIQIWTCYDGHDNQMWNYKDGSLWLRDTVDDPFETDMVIDWGQGDSVSLYSYHGGRNQRWLVRNNLDRDYSGNYIRIRNDSMYPAQCSLGQVGPLYWGVIYPGEEFFRTTGAVHFTMKCQLVLDGQETIDAWDAILPVANIVANVLLACATAGLSIKGTIAAQSATAINTVGSATIAGLTDQTLEAVLFSLILSGAGAALKPSASSAWSQAQGLFRSPKVYPTGVTPPVGFVQLTKNKASSVWNKATKVISHKRHGVFPEHFSSVVPETAAGPSTLAVATSVGFAGNKKVALKILGKLTKESLDAIFNMQTMSTSKSGVYANGKIYVLRGGPQPKRPAGHEVGAIKALQSSTDPNSVVILEAEPLRFESPGGLPSMASCESNGDCMLGACGRIVNGGDKVCCPEGDYGTYAGYDYCVDSTLPGESCMFDDMCLDGYCSGGAGAGLCIKGRDDGSDCTLDVHCLSGYCKGNSAGFSTGTCTQLLDNGEKCPSGYDGQCRSDACGRDSASSTDDIGDTNYICCPSGGTVTVVWDYCTGYKDEGGSCKHDEMCRSGFCNGSNGMGWVGQCYEPREDGHACLDNGNDRSCKSGECARDVDSNYVCCPNGAWNSGTVEYCRDMADKGESCPGSADYNDNYCKDSACARDVNNNYLCCPNGSWTSGSVEYCKDMANVGEKCPGSADRNDNYCKNGKACGKKSYDDNTYVCCADGTFVPDFWTTDVCKRKKGETCNSKEDAECAGSLECGRTSRSGSYKCCDDTWFCDIWDSGCDTGYWYCDTY